nr:DNA polymerase III subunit alpha [Planctomycetota bacterium]
SIVCYCLRLTNVDPVRYRLVFERFLAPERTDPPDIDIDFAWDERDELLAMTLARHGADHVAMVATHQGMHRWAALRETARAHGLPDSAIDIARRCLHDADAYGTPGDLPEPWPAVLAAADALAGMPRHLGLHCGGAVITKRPIRELVPVHPAAKIIDVMDAAGVKHPVHVPTMAWEKDGTEDLGFVKIDLLGNRSLAVVRDCLHDLKEDGIALDEHRWDPIGDVATKRIVAAGATMGCFYIESPSMRQLQAKVGSPDFDRLVVHSSIIRPAGNSFIQTYIARFHRSKECDGAITDAERAEWYPHPCLQNLLSDSFGVLSYQEDVMEVSKVLAGFGSKEANQLRKALGRSDTADRLQALAERFYQGAVANGVSDAVITYVWGMISSFAGYSFCKAHSASYAVVSFQCAYLKAHHPAHFLARVIANQGGYYHTAAYVEEARRLGVEIRGPCALMSRWWTAREGSDAIRIGLHLVKGLSKDTADRIIAARSVDVGRRTSDVARAPDVGRFSSLRAFKSRCRVARDELQTLCDAGALDALLPGCNAAQRSWLVAVAAREASAFIHPQTSGGQALIDLISDETPDLPPPVLRDLPIDQVRHRRFACLAFLPERHPLCLWRLPKRTLMCRAITAAMKDRRVSLIAWPIARKQVSATYLNDEDGKPLPRPRHEPMCFVTLEDETGLVETVWFPDAYHAYGVLLERGDPLRVSGTVDASYDFPTLTVERVETLGGASGGPSCHPPGGEVTAEPDR